MELTKCSLCFIKFSPKPHYSEVAIKSEEVLEQNNYCGAEERDPDPISNQMKIIFLLRKILEIPRDKCCEFLLDYGDPCSWMNCCPSCSGLIWKGKAIFDQMIVLQNQFKKLQNELKRTIISSVCVNDGVHDKSKWGVRETVRSIISQGAPDLIIASHDDERINNTIYSGIPGPIILSSDVVETHNQWSGVGVVDYTSYEADNDNQDPLAFGQKDDANDEQFVNILDVKEETEFCYLIENEGVTSNDELDAPKGEKSARCVSSISDQLNTRAGNKIYKCVICGKGFKTNWQLVRHQKTHTGEKLYECEFCGKRYTTSGNLKVHERTHTEEKRYHCTFCGKRFMSACNLKVHQRTHTGEKLYQCIVCKKGFTSTYNLKVHERTHTGEKPYQCSFCEKTFAQTCEIKQHERIHTGEKPYACRFCKRSFAGTTGLKQHERTHTGEKPYGCRFCQKRFTQGVTLKRHERIHTGEKP